MIMAVKDYKNHLSNMTFINENTHKCGQEIIVWQDLGFMYLIEM